MRHPSAEEVGILACFLSGCMWALPAGARPRPLSGPSCAKAPGPGAEPTEEIRLSPLLPFTGLPTEGLFHRHPGAPGAHGGGLLADGLGVEMPHHRDAHGGPRARAGQGCQPGSRPSAHTKSCPPHAALHCRRPTLQGARPSPN